MIAAEALTAALRLAAQGLPVFPCLESKAPACPRGFQDASAHLGQVRHLWRRYPGPLIGVPTGPVSGFDVLDLDPRHGGDVWLNQNRHRLPATRVHGTRSGGEHWLFQCNRNVRNSAGRIGPGVDVRASGGYVVWWPAAGSPVLPAAPIAQWPDWLLSAALPPPVEPLPAAPMVELSGTRLERYALGALKRAAERIATTGEGGRNQALNAAVYHLTRRFGAVLGPQRIADVMAAAALAAGLDRKEVIATLTSALRAGGAK